MIRKPPADWQPLNEDAAVRMVRNTTTFAKGAVGTARRSGHAVRGVVCYFFAIIWGYAAITVGLATGSPITIFGVGGLAAFMFWAGSRAFSRAFSGEVDAGSPSENAAT